MSQTPIRSIDALGRLIRQQRKLQGLTQGDLAAASGVSVRFVSELERGRQSAGVGRVLHVVRMLGLEMSIDGVGATPD